MDRFDTAKQIAASLGICGGLTFCSMSDIRLTVAFFAAAIFVWLGIVVAERTATRLSDNNKT